MKVWKHIKSAAQRRALDRQLQEEMQTHLEMLEQQFAAQGMPAEEARLAAMRQFGNTTCAMEAAAGTGVLNG